MHALCVSALCVSASDFGAPAAGSGSRKRHPYAGAGGVFGAI
jgi:hypothetical protein